MAVEAQNVVEDARYRIYSPRTVSRGSKQRFFKDRTRGLVGHIGGRPSRTQVVLIRRAVELEWLLTKLDLEGGLSAHDARVYLSMHNTLRATLSRLGLDGATGAADEPKPVAAASKRKPKRAAPKKAPAPKPEPEREMTLPEYLALKKAAAAPPSESEP